MHARTQRLEQLARQLPPGEQEARKALAQVTALADKWPVDGQHFGLIHGDFELDNLIWIQQGISCVDFDDSSQHWFAADVAFALRDLFDDQSVNIDHQHPQMRAFVEGYRSRTPADASGYSAVTGVAAYAQSALFCEVDADT